MAGHSEHPYSWTDDPGRPLVIGHRGAPRVELENTLASFQEAVDGGADGIELDVWRCRDGQLAVYHDTTVAAGGERRPVRSLGLIELRQAVQQGADPGHRVPVLAEVLRTFPDTLVNVELKSVSVGTDGLEEAVVSLLASERNPGRILISSFNPLALARVRRLNSRLAVGLLTAPDLPIPLSHTWLLPLLGRRAAVHPREDMLARGYPPLASGRRVHAWTVNDAGRARELAALGVHALITDVPGVLSNVLASPGTWQADS